MQHIPLNLPVFSSDCRIDFPRMSDLELKEAVAGQENMDSSSEKVISMKQMDGDNIDTATLFTAEEERRVK